MGRRWNEVFLNIYYSFFKVFLCNATQNNCKIRGWHGSRPGGSNHSLLCMKMYVSLSPWKCDCFEVWMLLAWLWLQNSCRLIKDFNTSFHNLLYWNSATVNSKLLEVYFSYLVTSSHTNSTEWPRGNTSKHILAMPHCASNDSGQGMTKRQHQ